MKLVKSGLAVLAVFLMVIIIPADAGSMWLMDDGEDDLKARIVTQRGFIPSFALKVLDTEEG